MDNNAIDDIKNSLSSYLTISLNEKQLIQDNIVELFKEFIQLDPLNISNPNFDKDLTNYIYKNIIASLENIYSHCDRYKMRKRIKKIIIKTKNYSYNRYIPYRSYKTSFIRRVKQNYQHLKNKIKILRELPQPQQRTDEWYIFRHNLLTASSIWKCFASQSIINSLIYEKCKPYTLYKNASCDSPLHWGQKYEPVSIQLYENLYNTTIEDFGCIQHPKYPFIGASPDGINVDANNPRFARMLEVKNIVNREINGNPKLEYWIQMQVQMETCDLNECDFLETRFIEYNTYNDFIEDGTFNLSKDQKQKGIILMFNNQGNIIYKYAPLNISYNDYNEWENKKMDEHSDLEWIRTIYWKLDQFSNVLVLRNKLWFNTALSKFKEIWDTIVKERDSGYDHRAPKRRKLAETNQPMKKCLINIQKLNT